MDGFKQVTGEKIRDFILGAQDGIVNVLGLVLGVASATLDTKIILISGLAGLFAESISMGAVTFTSSKAARDYYKRFKEKREAALYKNPLSIGVFVFIATLAGSAIPLIPFFFLSAKAGMVGSIILSGLALFIIGALKARFTIGDWKKSGLEMLAVGLLAAVAGYVIGTLLGNLIGHPALG